MAFYAHANGLRIVTARLLVPAFGLWSGDVQLADDTVITDPVTVTIGNLVLVGSAFRDGAFTGTRMVRLVGGFGGWRNTVPARLYSNAGGVKQAAVIGDAAAEVGEVVTGASSTSVGTLFARAAMPASRLLSLLVGREGWYVRADGTTVIGTRTTTPVASTFEPIAYRPDWGEVWIATEDPLSWLPGAVFTAPTITTPRTVASATFDLDKAGRLRVEALLDD